MQKVVLLVLLLIHCVSSAAPYFPNQGAVHSINEYEPAGKKLADVQCLDGDGHTTVVSLASVEPTGASCEECFTVNPGCGSQTYCLQFIGGANFNYQTHGTYFIKLDCVDSEGDSADPQYVMELRVIPNLPPSFPPPGAVTVTDTKNKKKGDDIYDIPCTDGNSDPLVLDMTVFPTSLDRYFYIGGGGKIKAEEDLNGICESSVEFKVTCKDPYNSAVGPVTIAVNLGGANTRPAVTGLNINKNVAENSVIGLAITTFSVTDDDTPKCSMEFDPPEAAQYYGLNGPTANTFSIVINKPPDYEIELTRHVNITVTCTDSFCPAQSANVYVTVSDVNDPITLLPNNVQRNAYEGDVVTIDPQWTPRDQDADDEATYSLVGGNDDGLFTIDSNSGVIESTVEYDVDGGARPDVRVFTVEAKDKGGSSSTATVTVSILDINDNAPVFNVSPTFTIPSCTSPGTVIGTLTATDEDSGYKGNNILRYSGSEGPIAVLESGAIIVTSALTQGSYEVEVTATDRGENPGPLTSDPATLFVFVNACPPGSTTPAPPPTTPAVATTTAAAATTTSAGSGADSGMTNIGNLTEPNAAGPPLEHNLGWIIASAVLGGVALLGVGIMVVKVYHNKSSVHHVSSEEAGLRKRHAYEKARYERKRLQQERMLEERSRRGLTASEISYSTGRTHYPPKNQVYVDPWKGRGLPY